MEKTTWARYAALGAMLCNLGLAAATLGCSESPTEEMNRGVSPDVAESTPEDPDEMAMSEEERRAKAAAEDEALERQEFNDSGQGTPE